jgi:hypothetical protein
VPLVLLTGGITNIQLKLLRSAEYSFHQCSSFGLDGQSFMNLPEVLLKPAITHIVHQNVQ